MRDYLVEIATVAPRPIAVVREATTWEEFPRLWGQLLDEVYAYVRQRPELATGAAPGELWQNVMQRFAAERGLEPAGPRWEIYGHMSDDPAEIETEIHYLLGQPI